MRRGARGGGGGGLVSNLKVEWSPAVCGRGLIGLWYGWWVWERKHKGGVGGVWNGEG